MYGKVKEVHNFTKKTNEVGTYLQQTPHRINMHQLLRIHTSADPALL